MMTTMQLEFPMLTIADKISDDINKNNTLCEDVYNKTLKLNYTSVDKLCYHSTNFTFADPLKSAVALTNTYLY